MVPKEGFEPSTLSGAGLEAAVSAVPPLGHMRSVALDYSPVKTHSFIVDVSWSMVRSYHTGCS